MGFACLFDDADSLLADWRKVETSVLTQYSARLRLAGEKAWNIYSVFLTADHCDENQEREIRWIEEDLDRTRKIAAAGLRTQDDVTSALLPLLPIMHRAVLIDEDPIERLRRRLVAIAPRAIDAVLNDQLAPKDVLPLLREQDEA